MGEIETKSTYIANANDVISSLVAADGDGDDDVRKEPPLGHRESVLFYHIGEGRRRSALVQHISMQMLGPLSNQVVETDKTSRSVIY
jgi:hypothetical protein